MSFYVHGWDIHIEWRVTGGAGVTGVRSGVCAATYADNYLSDVALQQRPQGIHAIRSGMGGARVTRVRFPAPRHPNATTSKRGSGPPEPEPQAQARLSRNRKLRPA